MDHTLLSSVGRLSLSATFHSPASHLQRKIEISSSSLSFILASYYLRRPNMAVLGVVYDFKQIYIHSTFSRLSETD